MGTSYPGAIDALTNPNASDMLDSPPHSTQHGDANDAIEAIETKLGTGASTPTTVGHVLKVTGAGASAWQAPAATLTVKESDGSPSVADVDTMSFANATITDQGSGDVLITIPASLTVEEVDGSPSVTAVDKLIFPNGSVTDSGSGDVTIRDVPVGFIGASVYNVAAQSIPNITGTALSYDSELFDTDGFHSTSVNTGRLTVPAGMGGKYLVTLLIRWATDVSPSGLREASINKNGSTAIADSLQGASQESAHTISAIVDLAAGDYVTTSVYQDSGASLNVNAGQTGNLFSIAKLESGKVGQGIGASAYAAASLSHGTQSYTAIPFANEIFDTDGFHSTSVNTSRLTIPAGMAGKYVITYTTSTTTAPGGYGFSYVRKNGSIKMQGYGYLVGAATYVGQQTIILDLVAGDYLEVMASYATGTVLDEASVQIMRLDSGSANYTGPLWGSGTEFPTGPATNQRFTRTDRGIDYYYDGTRWLSTHVEVGHIDFQNVLGGGTTNHSMYGTLPTAAAGDSILIQTIELAVFVGTTCDGSNYWTHQVHVADSSGGLVQQGSDIVRNSNPGVWQTHSFSPGNVVSMTTYVAIQVSATKTGAPGGHYMAATYRYRLVG